MIKMRKLLIISGPTATGKTKLALKLAKLFGGELISADSRQVYKGMDIGTGKDRGTENRKQKTENRIHIWGYDLVAPNEEWSAAHFVKLANKLIPKILKRDKLPIVVGGTGLYIKDLLRPPETLFISPNKKLRRLLEKLTLPQLQNKLRRINSRRFNIMNQSDRQNPRRLIRALEIGILSPKGVSWHRQETPVLIMPIAAIMVAPVAAPSSTNTILLKLMTDREFLLSGVSWRRQETPASEKDRLCKYSNISIFLSLICCFCQSSERFKRRRTSLSHQTDTEGSEPSMSGGAARAPTGNSEFSAGEILRTTNGVSGSLKAAATSAPTSPPPRARP